MKMKKKGFISIGLIAIFVAALSQQTRAQLVDFYSSPGYSNYINTLINNHIWNSSMERYTKGYKGKSGSSTSSSSTSSGQARYEVPEYRRYRAVQFKSTGTRLTLQEYLNEIPQQDRAEVKALVLDIFKKYEAEAAAKGYPNDWALAFVSYVGLNSHVYNGRTEKPLLPLEMN